MQDNETTAAEVTTAPAAENEEREQAVSSGSEGAMSEVSGSRETEFSGEGEEASVPESEEADFTAFGFCEALSRGIREAGFTTPTPIQQKAIPEVLAGRDVIGQALTGSGKTAAYGLPSLELIQGKEGLQLLVLVPTRELAAQVSSELYKLGHYLDFRTAAFTGGQSYSRQEKLLREGVNALVATPGRLIDLLESGHFDGMSPSIIVVDEADEMLDMGFLDDVRTIFESFSGEHQTMLFSATMPKPVLSLAQKILHEPVDITTDISEATNNDIEQQFFVIEEHERVNAIIRLIDSEDVSKAMIFCRTREETDALNILLGGRGYNVNCLHGDMEQAQRSRVMNAFRKGEFDILVATDVAARGLDVDDVSHVFNFHLPFDSRGYVHRIGRTGRAGKSGRAITLVTPRELRQLESIRRSVGADIQMGRIPSRHEVLNQQVQRVFGELFRNDLDPEMYNQVRAIAEGQDQDPLVLFTKLLTKHLRGNGDQGPEEIGISGERLERLLHPERGRGGRFGRGDRFERGGRGRFGRFHRDGDFGQERPYRRDRDGEGDFGQERPYRRDRDGEDEFRQERPYRRDRDGEGEFRQERPYRRDRGGEGEFRQERPYRRGFEERAERPRGEFRERFQGHAEPPAAAEEAPVKRKRWQEEADGGFQSRFASYGGYDEPASSERQEGGHREERKDFRREHRAGVKFAQELAADIERSRGNADGRRGFGRDGFSEHSRREGKPYWEKFGGHGGSHADSRSFHKKSKFKK